MMGGESKSATSTGDGRVADRVDPRAARASELERARGLDLGRVRLPSPLPSPWNRWARLSLGQAYRFVLGHNRRHILQARSVTEHPQFPAG